MNAEEQDLKDVMEDLGMAEGFDVGLEMSSAATGIREMMHNMNKCGKIAMLHIIPTGFFCNWNKIIFKMLRVKGLYGLKMLKLGIKGLHLSSPGPIFKI